MLLMTKKKIIFSFVSFFIVFISLTTLSVKANNPSGMSLNYNSSTKLLDVTITHNTGTDPTHYIQSVTVRVNGSIVKSETYTSQPNSGTFTYHYDNITANIGATIQATAICSIAGTITRSITLTDNSGDPNGDPVGPNGDPVIPGYLGILIITAACLAIVLPKIYKRTKKCD
jgi:hypothetical protein